MDWNWFFSALAQSCAAIVGIMGAFVLSKVISNQASFREREAELSRLSLDVERLIQRLRCRSFKWVIKIELDRVVRELRGAIKSEEYIRTPIEYFEEFSFPVYMTKPEVLEAIQGCIDAEEERREARRQAEQEFELMPGMRRSLLPMLNTGASEFAIEPTTVSQQLNEERESIAELIAEVKVHCERVRAFRLEARSAPERSSIVPFAIAISLLLFFVGVLYPLGLMPCEDFDPGRLTYRAIPEAIVSFRGGLLALVGTIFSTAMLAFVRMSGKLAIPSVALEALQVYESPAGYSQYLKAMVENTQCEEPPEDRPQEETDG